MPSELKFKPGDRVVLAKNYSYIPNVGMLGYVKYGIISDENMYLVVWDKYGLEIDEFPDVFEGELEFEEVYNSPLFKALKET